jgi:hypothetical protein
MQHSTPPRRGLLTGTAALLAGAAIATAVSPAMGQTSDADDKLVRLHKVLLARRARGQHRG